MANIDPKVVNDFGSEWTRFDQQDVSELELRAIFDAYFSVFPWQDLPIDCAGADIGCGSGRWARFAAPQVGHLHCVEPSSALSVAQRALQGHENISFHDADIDHLPFEDDSLDFFYSLGVLHHVPDTELALKQCVRKLKPGGLALVYLYYRFDNRPWWFQRVWQASEVGRRAISKMPTSTKNRVTDVIAASVYYPLARAALVAEQFGADVDNIPLSSYRDRSFYMMRTDALDRFGTRLEQQFTRDEILQMMKRCGLRDIKFSDSAPFWCAVGTKA
ncbi:MAG: class I SAM-dependent methyltransferase [Bradymonadaceae bacterium]|nr:class I SAM-dependent methyltransferase [Lujinxingiaceae bacterium]